MKERALAAAARRHQVAAGARAQGEDAVVAGGERAGEGAGEIAGEVEKLEKSLANANPRLRLAMDKATDANMPKDNIQRAIQRGVMASPADVMRRLVMVPLASTPARRRATCMGR